MLQRRLKHHAIAWYEGGLVLLGALSGGYVAAHYSRQLPQDWVRAFVIIAIIGITTDYFYQTQT